MRSKNTPSEPRLAFGGAATSPAKARKAQPKIELVPLHAERRVSPSARPHIRAWLESFLVE